MNENVPGVFPVDRIVFEMRAMEGAPCVSSAIRPAGSGEAGWTLRSVHVPSVLLLCLPNHLESTGYIFSLFLHTSMAMSFQSQENLA